MGAISKAQGAACSKCGRRSHLDAKQLESGFTCPRCGTVNKPDGAEAGAKEREAPKEDAKELLVQCPVCRLGSAIPKERKFKQLCLCPHCDSVFVKPLPGPSDKEREAEAKKAPDEGALEKEEAEKEAQPPPDPPNPEQRRLLAEMLVAGMPESSARANEILSTLNGIASDAICGSYMGFGHLHSPDKAPVIKNLIASPLFRKIYFEGASLSYEEAKALLEEPFKEDPELVDALRRDVNEALFERVALYIDEFARLRHGLSLEKGDLNKLALKSFRRGFGARLRPQSFESYGAHGLRERQGQQAEKVELAEAVRKRTKENEELEKLLQDAGFVKRPDPYEGCLLFAAFALGCPSLLAWWIAV